MSDSLSPPPGSLGTKPVSSPWAFAGIIVVLFAGLFSAGAPDLLNHGLLFAGAGVLILCFPPVTSIPRSWWLLSGLFLAAASLSFLPAAWFPVHDWRSRLESVGLETGSFVVIQSQQAAETLVLFAVTLFVILWLVRQRPSRRTIRNAALAFVGGVAIYAIVSEILRQRHPLDHLDGFYGLFPNRNHTGTLLAMGGVTGIGCLVQAAIDRSWGRIFVALIATGLCVYGAAVWSISRGGLLLLAFGSGILAIIVGFRFLGWKKGLLLSLAGAAAAVALLALDTPVNRRLANSAEGISALSGLIVDSEGLSQIPPRDPRLAVVDFRVPVALDTLALIRDFPLTGVGPGQFRWVFPQYRDYSTFHYEAVAYHPDNDWLWLAAETGIPAAGCIVVLVGAAFFAAARSLGSGSDRIIRSACLVAAFLVPFHGAFDVPGHRVPLAWSAAFLFALAYRPAAVATPGKRMSWIAWRPIGFSIAVLGAFLLWQDRSPSLLPASVRGVYVKEEALSLWNKDLEAFRSATGNGESYDPKPEADPLREAHRLLTPEERVLTLHADLWNIRGNIDLRDSDQHPSALRAFAIERVIDPAMLMTPLNQANNLVSHLPEQADEAWREAVRRYLWLDSRHYWPHAYKRQANERLGWYADKRPHLRPEMPPFPPDPPPAPPKVPGRWFR